MPLSVLKPVKSLDPDFREDIESFGRQDYPEYEVLLGFTDEDDEAIKVALETAGFIRGGRVRCVVSNERMGVNLKGSNLQGLLNEAKYHLLVISDSDIRVGEGYMNTYIALDFIPSVIVAGHLEGIIFGLGASMLLSK